LVSLRIEPGIATLTAIPHSHPVNLCRKANPKIYTGLVPSEMAVRLLIAWTTQSELSHYCLNLIALSHSTQAYRTVSLNSDDHLSTYRYLNNSLATYRNLTQEIFYRTIAIYLSNCLTAYRNLPQEIFYRTIAIYLIHNN